MLPGLSKALDDSYKMQESACIQKLAASATLPETNLTHIKTLAHKIIQDIRERHAKASYSIDAWMQKYDLASKEGIALMGLAEALLRVSDTATINALIDDKISSTDWHNKLLRFTRTLLTLPKPLSTISKPIIRSSLLSTMKVLGNHFVLAENINSALKKASKSPQYLYSFDMLGEAARTDADADAYFNSYLEAIRAAGHHKTNHGISVKLSALDPRYEILQTDRVMTKLYPKIKKLALEAKNHKVSLTIDAEESERLELSLHILEKLCNEPELKSWRGLGLAVQAYQKRAFWVIDWLVNLAKITKKRLMIRLVKGAYWDTEIKRYQELGLKEYPVFTRKAYTDVSYIACAKKLLQNSKYIYPQFATHNAMTIAIILELAGKSKNYEFQCLHGMGHHLYDRLLEQKIIKVPCRVYAPIGDHKRLLSYLIRRLLENGANASFVNKVIDNKVVIDTLIEDPVAKSKTIFKFQPHTLIPKPTGIYMNRTNSNGTNIDQYQNIKDLQQKVSKFLNKTWQCRPLIAAEASLQEIPVAVCSPADPIKVIGKVQNASTVEAEVAIDASVKAFKAWSSTDFSSRIQCLQKLADLLEKNTPELIAMLMMEAGKVLTNAIGEIREAVDFCYYYAKEAEDKMSKPVILQGITGEKNLLTYEGRGVIVCISPWNFPAAIFLGQIVAALVTGNTVLAKPAPQTTLIAYKLVELCYEAGIPHNVLQLIPGPGNTIGSKLVASTKIAGVVFTGSTATAKYISRQITKSDGPIIPLIAETGGQNCMIVDSTALPEQVVKDIVVSGFDSAGQRCSALRVVFIQEDIADSIIQMLMGAMDCLTVAKPWEFNTDIGPVIDEAAHTALEAHLKRCASEATILKRAKLGENLGRGLFFAPTLVEISNINFLTKEVFGPIVHVIRYKTSQINKVIDSINNLGYGLTFGVHSRIQKFHDLLQRSLQVGNIYVNRSMIGATVGVQPFGGRGLSGTGPKAGGPLYLYKLTTEKLVCINTTATGGNTELLTLEQDIPS